MHKTYHHLFMVPKNLEPLLYNSTSLGITNIFKQQSTFRFLLCIFDARNTVGQIPQFHHPQLLTPLYS